ncbi:MAG TPA: FN3 associated domain-containing protein, partial [Bacteroidales bacterium]|nr:FN3 associated domain-containing protein [Bacteroidales bacterium]
RALPEVDITDRTLKITLQSEAFEPEIRFTTDGTVPTRRSQLYSEPFKIAETSTIKAAVFVNGKSTNQVLSREYNLHKAFAAETELLYPASQQYQAQGKFSLVDGIKGTRSFQDGNWKGFRGNDMVATIDLGKITSVESIEIGSLQSYGAWIFLPQWVTFEVSADGGEFSLLEKIINETSILEMERKVKRFSTSIPATNVRFVRVTAKSQGVCPPGHSGAGLPAWLFVDEIVVK